MAQHRPQSIPVDTGVEHLHLGAGASFTWVEPEDRMVVIVPWIEAAAADAFFGRVLRAVEAG